MNNCKDIRHDLVQLDWPQGYIGANTSSTYHQNGCEQGDTCDATIIEYIKEIVKPLGDVAVMGEAYNPTDTPWAFMSVFDGVIDGAMKKFDPEGSAPSAEDVEAMFSFMDEANSRGVVTRTVINLYEGPSQPQLKLQTAFLALLGGYYAMQSTGGVKVSNGDYGDFGSWSGEPEMALVLKAVQSTAALHPMSSRLSLPVSGAAGSGNVYAALRTSADKQQHVIVAFNFGSAEAEIVVELKDARGIEAGQRPVNLLSNGSACAPVSPTMGWPAQLPAFGYAAVAFSAA